jgi:DNA-nicking Smr family endonuclease
MNKSSSIVPEELELFRQTVGDVKKLTNDRAEQIARVPAPIPRFSREDERQVLRDMLSDYFDPADLETGEELSFCREGLQHNVLRKLRRGQFRVEGVLDLHGMNVPAARQALIAFIKASQRDNMSCVQ